MEEMALKEIDAYDFLDCQAVWKLPGNFLPEYPAKYEAKKNGWIYTETVKSTIPLRKYKGKWKISKITKLMEKYVNCNFYEGLNAVDKLYD